MNDQPDPSQTPDLGIDQSHLTTEVQLQMFLSMREQNIELLRLAAEIAGFSGEAPATTERNPEEALRKVWEVYSEFYSWVDPEDVQDDIAD